MSTNMIENFDNHTMFVPINVLNHPGQRIIDIYFWVIYYEPKKSKIFSGCNLNITFMFHPRLYPDL